MASYNRVILIGNLTRDPEIKRLPGDSLIAKFTLAVNRRTKNGDETTYVDIVAWDKLAEICEQYLKKGMNVLVDGRLVIRSYEDKNGAKRKITEVVIETLQMLDKKDSLNGNATLRNSQRSVDYDLEDEELAF